MLQLNQMYTPNEVAEKLDVSAQTVRHWIRTGAMKAIKLGAGPKARIKVSEMDLQAFLAYWIQDKHDEANTPPELSQELTEDDLPKFKGFGWQPEPGMYYGGPLPTSDEDKE